ncbi:hypothetical protein FRB90_006987, partial [Tulasnella sp. 427]
DDIPIELDLEVYVHTDAFDRECVLQSTKPRKRVPASDESDSEYEDSSNNDISRAASLESDCYEVSKIEAHLYYAGFGHKGREPKLIYRTSDDEFVEPEGPEAYTRLMKIFDVPENHKMGKDGLWGRIRDRTVELLDQRGIKLTSVDFVRFTWLNKKPEGEMDEDEDDAKGDEEEADLDYEKIPSIKPVEDGIRYYTKPTIWIGFLTNTLTGAVAHESAKEILAVLQQHNISNVDIAYQLDSLKGVIDNLSTALSIPISGRKTRMQGTLGPYFNIGNKLCAITARHNLFLHNEEYNYHESGRKIEVVVMKTPAFTKYLTSIQALIGTLNKTIDSPERTANKLRSVVEAGGDGAQLEVAEGELTKNRREILALKKFFVDLKKNWSKSKDRIICYVLWAPPIGVGVPPHRYTRDLCVIELYKDKFKKLLGNILSLGPEYSPAKFEGFIYDRDGVPSEFKYPDDGLLALKRMLTVADVSNPNSKNLDGDRIHRVIKRGSRTNTTVGTLIRFMSHVRKYFVTGKLDSLEVPILSHENEPGTFSKGGDSGSLIVSALGEFVALLTGGTSNGTYGSDITFATILEWVWELVVEKFPDASLSFDDLDAFLADVV